MYDMTSKKSDNPYRIYDYYGLENKMLIIIKDERNNEIKTYGSDNYGFQFDSIFFLSYSQNYDDSYIKEKEIHFKFNKHSIDKKSHQDLAFSYTDNYNLKIGKYKIELEDLYNDEKATLKSAQTISPCDEQTFEVRKDYEEEVSEKYLIL